MMNTAWGGVGEEEEEEGEARFIFGILTHCSAGSLKYGLKKS